MIFSFLCQAFFSERDQLDYHRLFDIDVVARRHTDWQAIKRLEIVALNQLFDNPHFTMGPLFSRVLAGHSLFVSIWSEAVRSYHE